MCGDCVEEINVNGKNMKYDEIRNILVKNVPVKDTRYKFPFTFLDKTFLGSELV